MQCNDSKTFAVLFLFVPQTHCVLLSCCHVPACVTLIALGRLCLRPVTNFWNSGVVAPRFLHGSIPGGIEARAPSTGIRKAFAAWTE